MALIVLAGIIAYLIGSVPSAVWIGKIFYGKDLRQFGSGNAGATNTFRVLGRTPGIIVLVMDISKGVLAVLVGYLFRNELPSPDMFKLFEVAMGFIATMGHVYPVFAGFKGGKGVATLTGAIFASFPLAVLVTGIIFLTVFLLSHYISLGSIVSSLLLPLIVYFLYNSYPVYVYPALLFIPVFIIYTHRSNISRLIKGEENKMYLFKKKAA